MLIVLFSKSIVSTFVCIGRKAGVKHVCGLNDLHNFTTERSIFMDIIETNPMRFLNKDDLISFSDYVVEITIQKSINGIEDGTFDLLTSVHTIKLEGNDLVEIKEGTFKNLPIVYLFLSGNNIKNIQRGAFSQLHKLESLYLSSNHLKIINNGIFNGLKAHDLDLSHNDIVYIENGSFYGMKYLKNIYFNDNMLIDFYGDRLFHNSKYLVRLELENNLLTYISYENFKSLSGLKYIDLNNNIIIDVHKSTFNESTMLKSIRLSGNRLSAIDINVPRSLSHLYLERNHLSHISSGFLSKIVGLKALGLYGNPWKCSCYDLLLKWAAEHKIKLVRADDTTFSTGKKPVCIVLENASEACDEKTNRDTIRTYLKTTLV